MRFGVLKREARVYIFTRRQPNLFLVTALFLIFVVFLMGLVGTLSEIDRFQMELVSNFQAAAENFIQMGGAVRVEIPAMSLTYVGLFFFIVPWMFRWILELGYLYYARGIVRGEAQSYRSLFEGFHYFRKALVIRAVQAILYWGGLALFILPGIWALCSFSQANLILLDHPDRGAFWCLRESRRLMRGRKPEYFLLAISFFGWWLLTMAPFINLAALLWYRPYATFTYVGYYNSLIGQRPQETQWQKPGMF